MHLFRFLPSEGQDKLWDPWGLVVGELSNRQACFIRIHTIHGDPYLKIKNFKTEIPENEANLRAFLTGQQQRSHTHEASPAPSGWKVGWTRTAHIQFDFWNTHSLNTSPEPTSCPHKAQRAQQQKSNQCISEKITRCIYSPGGRRGWWAPGQTQNLRGIQWVVKVHVTWGWSHTQRPVDCFTLSAKAWVHFGGGSWRKSEENKPCYRKEVRVFTETDVPPRGPLLSHASKPHSFNRTCKWCKTASLNITQDNSTLCANWGGKFEGFLSCSPELQCFCQRRARDKIKATFNSPI